MLLAAALLLPRLVGEIPPDAIKLPGPGVQYRANVAAATSKPWVNADGWRLERDRTHVVAFEVNGDAAALATAEACAYQREALVKTDAAGQAAFGRALEFCKSVGEGPTDPVANVGVVDDGSPETGEVMNLLARHNLMYRIVKAADLKLQVTVALGSPEFPRASAANPDRFAQEIRQRITDEKRVLRVYGSDVVLARLTGDGRRERLQLINYGRGPVRGLHVRVMGTFAKGSVKALDVEGAALMDYEVVDGGTEFTLPEMKTYTVIDLEK